MRFCNCAEARGAMMNCRFVTQVFNNSPRKTNKVGARDCDWGYYKGRAPYCILGSCLSDDRPSASAGCLGTQH